MKIEFKINLKPVSRSYQLRNVKVTDPQAGPHAISCPDCEDSHFAAFPFEQSPEYFACMGAIGDAATAAMKKLSIYRPFIGSVKLDIIVQAARPKSHYTPSGDIRSDCSHLDPMSSPTVPRCVETVMMGLKDIAFNDHKQITKQSFEREYAEGNSLLITVEDIQSEPNQMLLF